MVIKSRPGGHAAHSAQQAAADSVEYGEVKVSGAAGGGAPASSHHTTEEEDCLYSKVRKVKH